MPWRIQGNTPAPGVDHPPLDSMQEELMGRKARAALLSLSAASLAALMVDYLLGEMSSKPRPV